MMVDGSNGFAPELGDTREQAWVVDTASEIVAGCHVPGHYAAGMRLLITGT